MARIAPNLLLLILAVNTLWFVFHAAGLGARGLTQDLSAESRLWHPGAPVATVALFFHMVLGAVLTVGAPLQAMPVLRNRLPWLHRRLGYALAVIAVLTGLGGLIYIGLLGTVGGWWMSIAFAAYGGLVVLAAVNTVYHALAKDLRQHARWATRLVILAVGSWIYRMHYAFYFMLADGDGHSDAFTGWFDRVNVWAFYLPYLLVAEAVFALQDRRRARLARKAPTA